MGEGAGVECWPRRHPDYGETPRKIAGEKTKKQTLRVEGPKEITPADLSVPGALPQHLVRGPLSLHCNVSLMGSSASLQRPVAS